ncbi:MAG: IS630 family transposase, partial [Pseudomonadota bacterium]
SAEIMFSDEARFGTHSKLGHGWFKKGSRTQVPVKLGYKNFYLYGCTSPTTGKIFSLLLPKANTTCMNLFLEGLADELQSKKVVLVVDGAGWHKSITLIVPQNIILVYLPAYSPELNPIERLWLYIKRAIIRNRVYKTIEDLEDAVCDFINCLSETTIRSICNLDYLSNYKV